MTAVRVGLASSRPAQLGDPALARWIGLGFVALLGLTMLLLVVRYGSERDRGGSDSGRDARYDPATGPRDRDDPTAGTPAEGDHADGAGDRAAGEWGDGGRPGAGDRPGTGGRSGTGDRHGRSRDRPEGGWSDAGYEPPGEDGGFDHSVVGERRGELLVEVGDGRRAASFVVADEGATVEPVADPARRHGEGWVADAERHLGRAQLDAGTRGDATAGGSDRVERRFGTGEDDPTSGTDLDGGVDRLFDGERDDR